MTDVPSKFDPKAYWESRLSQKYSLAGVGDIRMPLSYNRILYSLRRTAFLRALRGIPDEIRRGKVLDIGSGSGFYVDLWKRAGASVSGSDITGTAVKKLAVAHPGCRFIEWDAGSEQLPGLTNFDAISAFDVFFHIVDDQRYSRAISNVSALLRSGGYFLYSDYFMRGEEKRMEHIAFRSLQHTQQIMESCGLREITRLPVFYMMNSPVVTSKRMPRLAFNALLRLAGRGEVAGQFFGWCAYPIERLLLTVTCEPTGTELVVYKKT